jgi:hypothetical protein
MANRYAQFLKEKKEKVRQEIIDKAEEVETALAARTEEFSKRWFEEIDSAFRQQIEDGSYGKVNDSNILLSHHIHMNEFIHTVTHISFTFEGHEDFTSKLCLLIAEKYSSDYGIPLQSIRCDYDVQSDVFKISVEIFPETFETP